MKKNIGLILALLGFPCCVWLFTAVEETWQRVLLSIGTAMYITFFLETAMRLVTEWQVKRTMKPLEEILKKTIAGENKTQIVKNNMNVESNWSVSLDDETLRLVLPDGAKKEIAWKDVKGIFVETNDLGPLSADVWWHVSGESAGITFPSGATGEDAFLNHAQSLPNFNNEELIKAMGCTENEMFVVWVSEEKTGTKS
jgi:hypothetical protein